MAVHGAEAEEASYETDRMRFIGRGNTVANPQAMTGTAGLSGSEGAVLDPIVAIRRRITLDAGETVTVDIVTGVAETREASLLLVEKYRDRRLADRVFELAWTHSQVLLRQINATEADAQLYGQLAGAIVYANAALRANAAVLARTAAGRAACGAIPFPAICPSCWCRSPIRPTSNWSANWSRRRRTGAQGAGGGPDDLERRSLRLPAGVARADLGLISAGADGIVKDRPGGIFVRPAGPDRGGGSHPVPIRGARPLTPGPRTRTNSA
jgi:cyclic beta-1,2-glucan synthetase